MFIVKQESNKFCAIKFRFSLQKSREMRLKDVKEKRKPKKMEKIKIQNINFFVFLLRCCYLRKKFSARKLFSLAFMTLWIQIYLFCAYRLIINQRITHKERHEVQKKAFEKFISFFGNQGGCIGGRKGWIRKAESYLCFPSDRLNLSPSAANKLLWLFSSNSRDGAR